MMPHLQQSLLGLLSRALLSSLLLAAGPSTSGSADELLRYESPQTQTWKVGLQLDTRGSTIVDAIATFPIFMDWPEQTVRLVDQQIDPSVSFWEARDNLDGVKQIFARMNRINGGSTSTDILLTFQIDKSRILGPSDQQIAGLQVPKRIDKSLRGGMGSSPFINTSDNRIKAISKQIAAADAENDWQLVERVYDWVRENIEYVEGDLKSVSQALRDGTGDCEEMTSIFIAICRNLKIPSRMVWIPGHCYPEFYLENEDQEGAWFPCQVAGTRQFGKMDEYRPIIQKGDRFRVPEQTGLQRYVSEFFSGKKLVGSLKPRPRFVREIVD